jgi:hypothetical protein
MRRGYSSHEGSGRATRGVRADWVGAKPSNASNRIGGSRRGIANKSRPLTHDSSVPHLRKEDCGSGQEGNPRRKSSGAFTSLEFRRSVGRACEPSELQKSTSGAGRRALAGEEPAKAAVSSPPEFREAKERRKPGLDGKVQGRVAGSRSRFRESGAERALVEERRSGSWKPWPLTRWRQKRFWSGHTPGLSASEGLDDMGRQRKIRTPRPRPKTPWRWGAARGSFDQRSPPGTCDARSPRRIDAGFV